MRFAFICLSVRISMRVQFVRYNVLSFCEMIFCLFRALRCLMPSTDGRKTSDNKMSPYREPAKRTMTEESQIRGKARIEKFKTNVRLELHPISVLESGFNV